MNCTAVYPFSCWWTSELFPVFSYDKLLRHEHLVRVLGRRMHSSFLKSACVSWWACTCLGTICHTVCVWLYPFPLCSNDLGGGLAFVFVLFWSIFSWMAQACSFHCAREWACAMEPDRLQFKSQHHHLPEWHFPAWHYSLWEVLLPHGMYHPPQPEMSCSYNWHLARQVVSTEQIFSPSLLSTPMLPKCSHPIQCFRPFHPQRVL